MGHMHLLRKQAIHQMSYGNRNDTFMRKTSVIFHRININ